MPGQVLDIASPLATPLGTPDPTYVSQTNPGIGNGLDGSPDLMFVNTIQATSDVEEVRARTAPAIFAGSRFADLPRHPQLLVDL
jgi:hypothetical protein